MTCSIRRTSFSSKLGLRRLGFTLVELLVVIAIIGVLAALLIPAIQAAREAARRATCQNNLKQLSLAIHSYHDAQGRLPALYNGTAPVRSALAYGLETFSWQSVILPYLEQQPLHEMLAFDKYATDRANQPAVTTALPVSACPSTPRESPARGLWFARSRFDEELLAETTDYAGSEGYVQGEDCIAGAWGEVIPSEPQVTSAPQVRSISFSQVTDGLSQTGLIIERAALPNHYFEGGVKMEPHDPPRYRTWGNVGLWAISAEMLRNHLHPGSSPSLINSDNLTGLYSFHPGGAHVALADASVRYADASTPTPVVLALVSREGEELVDIQLHF